MPLRPYLIWPLTTSQDLTSLHSPPCPLCSRSSFYSWNTPSSFLPQGLCTCCPLCLGSFPPRFSESWLFPDIQISVQTYLLRAGLPQANRYTENSTPTKNACSFRVHMEHLQNRHACISFNIFPMNNMI